MTRLNFSGIRGQRQAVSCPIWRRWLAALALPLAAVLAVPAQAQVANPDVLVVSTDDKTANGLTYDQTACDAFTAQANALTPALTTECRLGSLSDAATLLNIPASVKLLVILTVNEPVAAARMTEITTALAGNKQLAIVAFIDSCDQCSVADNLEPFITALDNAAGSGMAIAVGDNHPSVFYTADLNPASSYEPTFHTNGLDALNGFDYRDIAGVPPDYALFIDSTQASDNAIGLFMPHQAVSNGNGACVFLIGDSDVFSNNVPTPPPQPANDFATVAKAFLHAATDSGGACALPAAPPPPPVVPTGSGLGAPVPALGQPALALLALLLAGGAAAAGLRRRGR